MPTLAQLVKQAQEAKRSEHIGPRIAGVNYEGEANEVCERFGEQVAALRTQIEHARAIEERLRNGDRWLREHDPVDEGYRAARQLHGMLIEAGWRAWIQLDVLYRQTWDSLCDGWHLLQHVPRKRWPTTCRAWGDDEPPAIWATYEIGLEARTWPLSHRELWIDTSTLPDLKRAVMRGPD